MSYIKYNSEQYPRVSIIVITYNSASFVIETLDSAFAQTYEGPIELIISDDCSTDDTIALCKKWLSEHRGRFVSSQIVESSNNTGIPANCNRGINASHGEWIKIIAGDDILLPTCISQLYLFARSSPLSISFIASKHLTFSSNNDIVQETTPSEKDIAFFSKTSKEQFEWFLTRSFNIAPSSFYKRDVFAKYGLFDERYPFFEDYPFWLKILKSGEKIYLLDSITVLYRMEASVTRDAVGIMPARLNQSIMLHFFDKVLPNLSWRHWLYIWKKVIYFTQVYIILYWFNNKNTFFARSIMTLIGALSPVPYIQIYKRCFR